MERVDELSEIRTEMRGGFAAVRTDMDGMTGTLRGEMRAGDEETRRFMRALYEDLVVRIERISAG